MRDTCTINRLKKVLIYNKDIPSSEIQKIIKSDIIKVLNSYTTLEENSIFVNFNIEKNGGYNFSISGKVSHIKDVGLHIN